MIIGLVVIILLVVGVVVAIIAGTASSDDNNDERIVSDNHIQVVEDTEFDYTKEFTFSAKLQINALHTYGAESLTTPTTLSCETLTNSFKDEHGLAEWFVIDIESVSMSAADTNLLLRCLANSDMVAEDGYAAIMFKGWVSLDGLLDTDVLQELADAAPNA